MSDTHFPVRYSQLNHEALKNELINRYELREPVSCQLFRNGMNDVYIVKTEQEVYFLRISLTGVHEYQDYEEETSIISSLSENGICAAAPVPCKTGNYVWSINAPEGNRHAVLFAEAKNDPSEDKVKKAYNLGHMVAQMHMLADEKNFVISRAPIDLIQLTQKPLEMLQPHLNYRPNDYEFLSNAANELGQYINEKLTMEKPYYGFCHGDIHLSNVFFKGDMPIIFDFDCMGNGWRAHDICVFVWNNMLGDEKYIESEAWKAFLDGYNSVRILSDNELNAINAFGALRGLWVMGIHADLSERNSCISIFNDHYFNFFINNFKLWYNRVFPK
ncbi:MAG: aminoglycoside phosphotransferase [Clostridia bacterium]|nr:aminoglycoside phosphotransferase [Clostridia bacterium]